MEEEASGSAWEGDAWLWNAAIVLTAAPPGADARAATMAAMLSWWMADFVAESGAVAANISPR